MELDPTDRKLLGLLQANALLTVRELAQAVNLSPTPVHERIRKLEQNGTIQRYVALLNRKALHRSMMVFCFVTLDKQKQESFQEFNSATRQMPEVLECCVISGQADYLLKVIVPDMEAYNTFYQSRLSTLESVLHISSSFVIEEVKNTTEIAF